MMKRTVVLLSLLLMFALVLDVQVLHGKAQQPSDVLKIVIDGPIHPITEEYISRAVDSASSSGAKLLLITLRTPGGLSDSTRGIVQRILQSKVPVAIYVSPTGSRAASAGFFILESADVAAMAPGTNTGAAHPVLMGGAKVDDVMKAKLENDSAAFMRSYAGKRGRNAELAESAVRESKSWTDQEALSNKLIDVIAKDETDLWRQLEGREITRFNGDKQTLRLGASPSVSVLDMTLKQQILGWLMDPNIAFLVFALGALALYAEYNHPGAVVPGVVGIICILVAVFALNLLPTRFAALTLILAAFVLFALEAKFATHGILGVGGIAALTLGGLLLVDGPIPEMRVKLWTALSISIPFGAITIFLMTIALKARKNKVITGEQGLIGETGYAFTALEPAGKVFVHGELWDAHSPAPIALGELIKVTAVHGFQLQVERTTTDNSPVPQVREAQHS